MASFDPAAPVVLRPPDGVAVDVHAGIGYRQAGGRELPLDLYRPAGRHDPVPAVLLVHGEADPAVLRGVRGWGQYTGWGRLLAAQGLAAVVFEHRAVREAGLAAVDADVDAAIAAVADRADELGLDHGRLGMAGFSAGATLASRAVARAPRLLRCAALCYGPPDLEPDPALPPVLVVRAGRDHPDLNRAIEAFVIAALAANLPVELVNHADGYHGFRHGRRHRRVPPRHPPGAHLPRRAPRRLPAAPPTPQTAAGWRRGTGWRPWTSPSRKLSRTPSDRSRCSTGRLVGSTR